MKFFLLIFLDNSFPGELLSWCYLHLQTSKLYVNFKLVSMEYWILNIFILRKEIVLPLGNLYISIAGCGVAGDGRRVEGRGNTKTEEEEKRRN